MKLNNRFLFSVLAVVVAAAGLVGNAGAATYVVGDNLGWTVPSGGAATYANWASQPVFRVGDVLVFNFTTGAHDVAHVTRAAYDGCSSTAPLALATVGPANFTLNATGAQYYICTFGQHCTLGQKLTINVSSASATPAPAPAPAPAPTPPSGAPIPNPIPAPSQPPSGSPSMPPSPMSGSPGPTPSASATPPSPGAPGSNESPGPNSPPGPFLPPGTLSPPPAPSSAATTSINTLIVVFVSMSFGIMM